MPAAQDRRPGHIRGEPFGEPKYKVSSGLDVFISGTIPRNCPRRREFVGQKAKWEFWE